ncbi:MAG TPA: ribonuclease H-like domain-containing protein [Myxococcaceae bacterium]|nr:ribonuclease H-like domain-containing protein [Myxococcaceae bacterium]
MIRRTFQLVPGIGPWREKDLWARGLETWDAVRADGEAALGPKLHAELIAGIDRVEEALHRGDLASVVRMLPAREHWRLWPLVADEALCLDIEADGVGDRQRPTVAGVLDVETLATFVEGRNLDGLPGRLSGRRVWVTFNGASFDLPVLRHAFPGLPEPVFHLDLKPLCRRIGLGGGLKATEDRLGIARPPHLRGQSGMDAVVLWRAYHATGDVEALRFLIEYNLYDAFQLRAVADHAFNRAAERLHWPDRVTPWERGMVLYDLSRLLLAVEPTPTDCARAERLRAAET